MLFLTKFLFANRPVRRGLCYLAIGVLPLASLAADAGIPVQNSTASASAPPNGSSTTAATGPAQPATPAKVPLVIPDPVPDNVNPFADKVKPTPLKIPAPAALKVDIHYESFDGLLPLQMFISGPDFYWMFDTLDDWTVAPIGFSESAAFVYDTNPQARLSLALYKADFMPEITPDVIAQYLAAVRDPNPAAFVLLSPIPKDAGSLDVAYFSNFRGQSAAYALVSTTVVYHHQWFVDLNHQYVLVIDLAAPQALIGRLDSQVRFTLGRSKVLKGLGADAPKAPPAPANGSGTAPGKTTNS